MNSPSLDHSPRLQNVGRRIQNVVIACDRSQSMGGRKIAMLNHAMSDLLAVLQYRQASSRHVVMQILAYDDRADWLVGNAKSGRNIDDVRWTDLHARPGALSDCASAIREMEEALRNIDLSYGSHPPVLVLVSDGGRFRPYDAQLSRLKELAREKKAPLVAVSLSEVANKVLQDFGGRRVVTAQEDLSEVLLNVVDSLGRAEAKEIVGQKESSESYEPRQDPFAAWVSGSVLPPRKYTGVQLSFKPAGSNLVQPAELLQYLDEGGQAFVYKVKVAEDIRALKWYLPHSSDPNVRARVDSILARQNPDPKRYVWPEGMVTSTEVSGWGIVMPLIDRDRFKNLRDIAYDDCPRFIPRVLGALNVVDAYQLLAADGHTFVDVSDGNTLFDSATGEVRFCDCDNIQVSDPAVLTSVLGTPTFMAPEILVDEATPNARTDQHSVAILLFKLLLNHHPFFGRMQKLPLEASDIKQLCIYDPLFIFDPHDDRNRPRNEREDPDSGTGWHIERYWNELPQSLKARFIQAFGQGIRQASERVAYSTWRQVFSQLLAGLQECPDCGSQHYFASDTPFDQRKCPIWGGGMPASASVKIGQIDATWALGTRLYKGHFLQSNKEFDQTVIGFVEETEEGLRAVNDSNRSWALRNPDSAIEPGQGITLAKGMKLEIFGATAHVVEIRE